MSEEWCFRIYKQGDEPSANGDIRRKAVTLAEGGAESRRSFRWSGVAKPAKLARKAGKGHACGTNENVEASCRPDRSNQRRI